MGTELTSLLKNDGGRSIISLILISSVLNLMIFALIALSRIHECGTLLSISDIDVAVILSVYKSEIPFLDYTSSVIKQST